MFRLKIDQPLFSKEHVIPVVLLLMLGAIVWYQYYPPRNGEVLGESVQAPVANFWEYQCIDTMKYSRDTARSWNGRETELQTLINNQLGAIRGLGANCVALGTPYDEEFVPVLSKWVTNARSLGLKVWFRGNFSGWEGWFGYNKLASAQEHINKTKSFITRHPELFAEGDLFTPAPEAENGILGNPWRSDEAKQQLRDFTVNSYNACAQSFAQIQKSGVKCGLFSANGDVARAVYTPDSIARSGGVVVTDHYVGSSERFVNDVQNLATVQQAKVFVGEFGAPIPDINGAMNEYQQADFIGQELEGLARNNQNVLGLNYWVLSGGSTSLQRDDGSLKLVASTLSNYYSPVVVMGSVANALDKPVVGAEVSVGGEGVKAVTDAQGHFNLLIPANSAKTITIHAPGYLDVSYQAMGARSEQVTYGIILNKVSPSVFYRVGSVFNGLFRK